MIAIMDEHSDYEIYVHPLFIPMIGPIGSRPEASTHRVEGTSAPNSTQQVTHQLSLRLELVGVFKDGALQATYLAATQQMVDRNASV